MSVAVLPTIGGHDESELTMKLRTMVITLALAAAPSLAWADKPGAD